MSEAPRRATLADRALHALHDVIDPEVGFDVVTLGLVCGVEVDGARLHVRLTMTTPACRLGERIVRDAENVLRTLPDVEEVRVELVWDPPWSPDRMTPEAERRLGWSQ